jgi:hypothetical protein
MTDNRRRPANFDRWSSDMAIPKAVVVRPAKAGALVHSGRYAAPAERQVIEDRRRSARKLGLALQIGFLRMSGRLLDAVCIVPPALWRHVRAQFEIAAPDLASLRAMYRRAPTLN